VSGIRANGSKRLVIVSGRAHPALAEEIASNLGTEVVPTSAYDFANGEIYVRYDESVRGCDTFVVQSHCTPINKWLMESLIMVDALKRASAKSITVVAPCYPYARQDKKHRGREPISARLVADLFKTAGADRLMAVDLHSPQIQGFFDGPVDHLFAQPILLDYFKGHFSPDAPVTVVSPDMGRVKVADTWAQKLSAPLAIIHKRRDPLVPNEVTAHEIVGNVEGRTCLVVDDLIDTAGTILAAARALKEHGAARGRRRRHPRRVLRPGRAAAELRGGRRGGRHQHAADPRGQAVPLAARAVDRSPGLAGHPRGVHQRVGDHHVRRAGVSLPGLRRTDSWRTDRP
jgi:ribose-phosphate pyrophosphokinase